MKKIAFVIMLWFFGVLPVFGADLDGRLSDFSFSEAAEAFEENTGISVDFRSMVIKTASGDTEGLWSQIAGLALSRLLGEGLEAVMGLKILIVAAVLGGFLKNLAESFTDKETAETGFGVCYMLTVGTAMGAYLPMIRLLGEYSEGITEIVTGGLPLILAVIAAGGAPVRAMAYSGAVTVGSAFVSNGVNYFLVPLMKLLGVICVVNYISEEKMTEKLFEVLKAAVKYGIKGAAVIFTFIVGLNRLSSSLGESAVKKGAENIVGMVPVAGDIVKGSLDTGFAVLGSIRSGTGLVFALIIMVYALLPLVKTLTVGFAFKLIAGLTEPVCDKRIVELLDSLGDLTLLILSIEFVIGYIFVFAALIFTALTIG